MNASLNSASFDASPKLVIPFSSGLDADGKFSLSIPEVFEPLLVKGPKYKGARGGRGSGKSHFFGEQLVKRALLNPHLRAVCIREVQRSLTQSSKRMLEDKIRTLKVQRFFEITDKVIHILDDDGVRCGVIIFEGMQNHTADSIKSLEGFSIAWVEEAQALSQRSLDLLYPTIREAGGEIWFSWNPNRADDPVEKFMCAEGEWDEKTQRHVDPDMVCVQANFRDNPWFELTSLVNDMERDRRRDKDRYAHIWLGKFAKRTGALVFNNWEIAIFEPSPVVERYLFGADWGFSVDPSVLVRAWIGRAIDRGEDERGNRIITAIPDPRGSCLFIDAEAYKVGCEIDETPSLFAGDCPPGMMGHNGGPRWTNGPTEEFPERARHRGIPGAHRWPITADSARPETISFMKRMGFNIKGALKGPGSVEDGIEFLKNYDIYVLPHCIHTIDELSSYSWKVDPKTDEILPILEDKKNHVIDSLRYAVEGQRRGGLTISDAALAKV